MVEIPTTDWTWIDAAAVRFEQEWKHGAGQPPRSQVSHDRWCG
jgi:hypothetical protein